jgi:hypothetical protein
LIFSFSFVSFWFPGCYLLCFCFLFFSSHAQEAQLGQILGIRESNAALRQGAIIQSVTQLKRQEQEISELLLLRKRHGIVPAIEGLAAFREQLCSLFGVPVAPESHATIIEEVQKKLSEEDQVRSLLHISAEADLVRAVRKLSKVGQDDIEEVSTKVTEGDTTAWFFAHFTSLLKSTFLGMWRQH